MSASYPNAVKTFTNPSATSTEDDSTVYHDVQHADANDEINAIETELGANPSTITEATSPAASPTSVAQYLDMVATQLKAIVGSTHWYSSITKSLADLVTHIAASSGVHGVVGSLLGTTDTQTVTNKTMDANSNTFSNFAHGAEVDNPSSGVHGVTGSVMGTTDTQTVTNKDLSSATNTFPTSLVTLTGTQTLTNKRITKKVSSTTSASSLTPEVDTYDQYNFTALAAALTINNHATSTPTDGQPLILRIVDDGTSRSLTFGTEYREVGVTLPTATTAGKLLYLGFIWNAADSKMDLIAKTEQA